MHPIVRAMNRVSGWLVPSHFSKTTALNHFYLQAMREMLKHPGGVVADVAGGKRWLFPQSLKSSLGLHLVGVDIDGRELEQNRLIDQAVIADVCREIPTPLGKYAVITCRAGVEHFPDTEGFLRSAFDALEDGGVIVLWFPNKYAPFALLNQMLPNWIAKRLLRSLTADGEAGITGFRAYYNQTSARAFKKLSKRTGFEEAYFFASYYSSKYFMFFPPVFLVSVVFDYLRFLTGINNLASHYCFVLRKPEMTLAAVN